MTAATERKKIHMLERKTEIIFLNKPISQIQGASPEKVEPEVIQFMEIKKRDHLKELFGIIFMRRFSHVIHNKFVLQKEKNKLKQHLRKKKDAKNKEGH